MTNPAIPKPASAGPTLTPPHIDKMIMIEMMPREYLVTLDNSFPTVFFTFLIWTFFITYLFKSFFLLNLRIKNVTNKMIKLETILPILSVSRVDRLANVVFA